MLKSLIATGFTFGALLTAAPGFAQGPACTRADLQKIADGYVAAQTAGDTSTIPLGQWVVYTENGDDSASLGSGLLSKPLKIDFHRNILDTTACQTFTESVVTDPAHPYVLGTATSQRGGSVNGIDVLITDKGDWLFNAANTLKYSKAENWGEIPAAQRDSRETIIAAANAYLDYFNDKSVKVPWGQPCARLEGGLYTAKGAPGQSTPQDTCDVGVPSNTKLVDRRYIVDETIGAVAVLLKFGNNALPDAHTFRVEHGKIRYVHTITVCKTDNCGFKMTPEMQERLK